MGELHNASARARAWTRGLRTLAFRPSASTDFPFAVCIPPHRRSRPRSTSAGQGWSRDQSSARLGGCFANARSAAAISPSFFEERSGRRDRDQARLRALASSCVKSVLRCADGLMCATFCYRIGRIGIACVDCILRFLAMRCRYFAMFSSTLVQGSRARSVAFT